MQPAFYYKYHIVCVHFIGSRTYTWVEGRVYIGAVYGRGIATTRPLTGTPRYIGYLQVDSAVSAAAFRYPLVFVRVSVHCAVYTLRYIPTNYNIKITI